MAVFLHLENFHSLRLLRPTHSPYTLAGDSLSKPCASLAKRTALGQARDMHSRKAAVKLMHALPSHDRLRPLTNAGILFVSSSSKLRRTPRRSRKPTMIFGTPSRKDWIQNFWSFRSYLRRPLSFSMHALVFSSTQLTGRSGSCGFSSQTEGTFRRCCQRATWQAWMNVPQSTSPPKTSLDLPIPVLTIEQY